MSEPGPAQDGIDLPPLLAAQGLSKSYAAKALSEVDFALRGGEVHAVVGENGAGKSTLAGILAGRIAADRPAMSLRGRPYAPRTQAEARRLGVRLAPQEALSIGHLSVAERLLLDRLPHRWGWIDRLSLHLRARDILQEVGLPGIDPGQRMDSLPLDAQQLIAIGSCYAPDCQVLILDEPTAALADREAARLFAQLRILRARGVGVVFITHRLDEVYRVADRITVLRDGRRVGTFAVCRLPLEELVRLMAGRLPADPPSRGPRPLGKVILRVQGLCSPPQVEQVSFALHRGEILGLAGLKGAGRTAALRAIFGADRRKSGDIYLRESERPARIRSPRDAVRQGIALLTENRHEQGLLLPWTVRANITLAGLNRVARCAGWIRDRFEQGVARQWMRRLFVRGAGAEQWVQELSGGNQQKVLLARWLFRDCDILLFDEPTRGIDFAAKEEIHRHLLDLAAGGKAIVMAATDLGELLAVCDRIAVMCRGRIVATRPRSAWSRESLSRAVSGVAPMEPEWG